MRLGNLAADEMEQGDEKLPRSSPIRFIAGYDFSREIRLTEELALGDTLLLFDGDTLVAFALCHSVPLVEGRVREELRVLETRRSQRGRFRRARDSARPTTRAEAAPGELHFACRDSIRVPIADLFLAGPESDGRICA